MGLIALLALLGLGLLAWRIHRRLTRWAPPPRTKFDAIPPVRVIPTRPDQRSLEYR